MKTLATVLMTGCLALATSGAFAAAHTEGAKKDAMMKKDMTMQQCKDHMAMSKPGDKKDDAMMKKDTMCADMMKSDGGMMKKDGMAASAPMKK